MRKMKKIDYSNYDDYIIDRKTQIFVLVFTLLLGNMIGYYIHLKHHQEKCKSQIIKIHFKKI